MEAKLDNKKTAHDFIEFLTGEGVIDSSKAEAIKEIWRTRLKFGIIALREGFVTPEDLFLVLQEQAAKGDANVKIGEILLQKNMMTREQVDQVLHLQSEKSDLDAEVFAEAGLLPYEIIEGKLREFLNK